ncbi:MAG TPA: hypothetical protein PK867_30345, partial [Pirellulales bacterium]|nr:hypothetical protein [Pirellulales bacterium]
LASFLQKNNWELPDTGLSLSATVTTTDASLTSSDKTGAVLVGNDLLIGVDLKAARSSPLSFGLNAATNTAAAGGPIGFDASWSGTTASGNTTKGGTSTSATQAANQATASA